MLQSLQRSDGNLVLSILNGSQSTVWMYRRVDLSKFYFESVPNFHISVRSSCAIFGCLSCVYYLMPQDPDGYVGSVRETVGTAGFYNPRDGGTSLQLLSQSLEIISGPMEEQQDSS